MLKKTKVFFVSYSFLGTGEVYIRAKDEEEATELFCQNKYSKKDEEIFEDNLEIQEIEKTDLQQLASEKNDDPNRGDLYHEILKHTQTINELTQQTTDKTFSHNINRLTKSIDSLTKKYTQKQVKQNFIDPNQSTITDYLK